MTRISARQLRWITAAVGVLVVGLVLAVVIGRPGSSSAAPVVSPGATSMSPTATGSPSSAPVGAAVAPTGTPAPVASSSASAPAWASGLSVVPSVALDQTGEFGTGVSARLTSVSRIAGVGRLPGEKSGPALAITYLLHNGTGAAISLDDVVVDLYADDGRPGTQLTQDPHAASLTGTLAAGRDATGTAVLLLPDPSQTHANITVSYAGNTPAVAFQGTVAP